MKKTTTDPQLLLRGITVELEGNEADVVFARPVVSVDGEEFVVGESEGGKPELRALADRDRNFVRWFDQPDIGEIDVAEGVWIVGPRLLRSIAGAGTSQLFERLKAWAPLGNGFRWTTGTYRDYVDFMQSYANHLEVALYEAFFLRSRRQGNHARRVFRLYQAFALSDTLERALNCALYFSEVHDLRSFELEIADAVLAGHAKSRQHFESMVALLRTQVLSDRLRETLGRTVDAKSPRGEKIVARGTRIGTVKWFDAEKGFGFITPDGGGSDVFAHYSAVSARGQRLLLDENQRVEIEIAEFEGIKGARVIGHAKDELNSRKSDAAGHAPRRKG